MLRVVLGELRHRRGRTLALLAGILVATTSFTVLTGASHTQRLVARGTVARNFRGDYDVLVRPRGSRTALERRTGQVQPNFLSGLFGGISLAQWHRIERVPGVAVAAPIANIGYLLPVAHVRVDISGADRRPGRALLRADVAWRADRGLTRVADAPDYAYVTPNRLLDEPSLTEKPNVSGHYGYRYSLREVVPGRRGTSPVCLSLDDQAYAVLDGPFSQTYRSRVGCFSRANGKGRWGFGTLERMRPRLDLRWAFPLLLTAVDPAAEAKLTGLGRTLRSGRYLRADDRLRMLHPSRTEPNARVPAIPVLAASRTYLDEQADIAVERLSARATARFARPFTTSAGNDLYVAKRFLFRQPPGPVVERVRVGVRAAYAELLRELTHGDPFGKSFDPYEAQYVTTVWRVGPTRYTTAPGGALAPASQPADDTVWQDGTTAGGLSWAFAPPLGRDRWERTVTKHLAHDTALTPPRLDTLFIRAVGVFDPDRVGSAAERGVSALTALQPPELRARTAAAARRLGGRPLLPSANLGGYEAQPPGLITTLRAARAFGPPLYPGFDRRRPISAVRVRVAGVKGIDALSRERIRVAAQRIAAATGLDVDITAGASGAPTAIDLPAGDHGRPPLALLETWIRKGVAARILSAVDRKSLLLFALILVVCALFAANAASAAVRARRTELGVLACLGWGTGRLFALVLCEVGLVGLAAGVLGGLLALPVAALAGVQASPARAALAVPAACGLALIAGLVPAARAAFADPVAAVRPPVLEAGRAHRPRGVGTLALLDLARTPGRTALGALSLAIGVCALTLLLAATLAFHDVLVGTLLGDAVSVDVRATDYVAVAATVLLGVAAVADVLFLNLRERAGELATLTATGWDDGALGRLVAFQGLWIGLLGAATGAGLGLAGAAVFAGAVPGGLVAVTAGAALAGTLLAGAAALAPALWLVRAPVVPLLAGE
jgi:hypothetical protein